LFASSFAKANIKVAHLQIDAFSTQDKLSYRRFARQAEEVTAAICETVANTITRNAYVVQLEESDKEHIIGVPIVFKTVNSSVFKELNGKTFSAWPTEPPFSRAVSQRKVRKDDAKRIMNAVRAKIESAPFNLVTQDLLDIEYIQTHYRASIGDFVAVLTWAAHATSEISVLPWFGSSIAISKLR
jgi:hypothetical protein